MQTHAMHTCPAEMVGYPFGIGTTFQFFKGVKIFHIQRRCAGNRQGHTVHDHGIALGDGIEHAQRIAAGNHVVLGNDFKPVDGWLGGEDFAVVLGAKSETETKALG